MMMMVVQRRFVVVMMMMKRSLNATMESAAIPSVSLDHETL